ncbi:M20 family metallopeptidase [Thermomicrobiaceae bacterium CFH 74404]|uniref:Probable succinyl-diaminopimelate desuccinylase n=1 Tax=Thermalbibacter longus TaxID=2951981 RepID=A0AA41WBX9_9BACT|nr:M20 family metallopeptidase [Thermalbibacter longus]MCM8750146.1 M20 family metallopeptidase [Thermalbibacter longus]
MSADPRLDATLAERVLAEIREDEVIAFLRDLVRIPTVNPPGDVRDAAEYCRRTLAAEGFETEFETAEPSKPNLIAWLRAGDGPTLLFNSHLDVVPVGEEASWTHPPFAAEISEGRVYGRGANDDKASVTAQVMGAIALKRSGVPIRGTLIVNEVADEEVGGRLGAHLIAERPDIQPDYVIVGEPTLNRICVGERGGVGISVVVYGRTAHGALPWEGVNAIEGMARVITALQQELWPRLERKTHPYFAHASATISLIEGGVKTNVVPDRCSIFIDRRLIPGEMPEEAIAEVREVAERAVAGVPGLRVEVGPAREWGGRPAVMSPPESPVVQGMLAVNRFLGLDTELTGFSMGTDGRFFAAKGYPTIIYGPGDPSLAHKPDEWVGIDEVMAATRAYALAALAFLGARG